MNKATGKFWNLSDALTNISASNLPWFFPGTGVKRIVTFYRNLVPSSAELERLMSYFRLLDTPLTQARTPDTVSKMLMLLKDSPGPEAFDFELAITIWKYLVAASSENTENVKNHGRFVCFPNPAILPTPGKFTVRPFSDLLETRKKHEV